MAKHQDEGSKSEPQVQLRLTPAASGGWLIQGDLFLPDRPGELAEVSACFARHGGNIELFSYNRSQDPNLVTISAHVQTAGRAGQLADDLRAGNYLGPPPATKAEKVEITDPSGLLRMKVNLPDSPGALAAFATVLRDHQANVIYMSYDAAKSPGLAEMAMATQAPEEVSRLLTDLNERGYHYHVEWQGGAGNSIDDVIGLSLIERFLLQLKSLLPRGRMDALEDLIRSSEQLRQTLLDFKREAGESDESMAASEIFTRILQLATSSISRTGRDFSLRVTGPVELTPRVTLSMLACPSGGNSYLLRTDEGLTLIDSSFGLYWPDAKRQLPTYNFDPARIRQALFTHPDADHVGWAAPLEAEFGTAIYMHPDAMSIFQHENRAYGSGSRLTVLNGLFTRLVNRFTDLRPPKTIRPFPPASGQVGGFDVIGRLEIADLELLVLESLGGHVPANVFYFAPRDGLLFCADYLIDFGSLSERVKSSLSIARYLMTSTNSDSGVFGRELRQLAGLMLETQARLQKDGRSAIVFPGHGDFYRVEQAEDMLKSLAAA